MPYTHIPDKHTCSLPGSPVTPALRDPGRDAGLQLLCLAASAPVGYAPYPAVGAPLDVTAANPNAIRAQSADAPAVNAAAAAHAHQFAYTQRYTMTVPPQHHVLPPHATPYLPFALYAHPPPHVYASPVVQPEMQFRQQLVHAHAHPATISIHHHQTPAQPSTQVTGAHAPHPQHVHPSSQEGLPHDTQVHPVRKVKGPWRPEEDKLLTELVSRYGARRWTAIAAHIPGRTGKQARERWLNQLSPDLAKRAWSPEEDRIVMQAHAELGNRWSEIAKRLDGRTDNAVKNRFNTTIRRQISELSSATRAQLSDKDASDKRLTSRDTTSGNNLCNDVKKANINNVVTGKRKLDINIDQQKGAALGPVPQRMKVVAVSAQ